MTKRLIDFFEEKDEYDCWEWQGHLTLQGYGICNIKGHPVAAHRAVYELYLGKIPANRQLDHLCRNRMCVNPSHLDPVTAHVNHLRSDNPNRSINRICICGSKFWFYTDKKGTTKKHCFNCRPENKSIKRLPKKPIYINCAPHIERTTMRVFDGYNANTGKSTTQIGFRIYTEQARILKGTYAGNSSLIIRLLLEEFIAGRVPAVDTKFKDLIDLQVKQKEELKEALG